MITKNDCMAILVRLEDQGLAVNTYMRKLLVSKELPLDVLQFIAQHQGIEATNFYEVLRKKHNKNKSKLYTNIVRDDIEESEQLITLASLLTQILLHTNKLSEDLHEQFLQEVRAAEITTALNTYFTSGDTTQCLALLRLVKADLLVLEFLSGRRELDN